MPRGGGPPTPATPTATGYHRVYRKRAGQPHTPQYRTSPSPEKCIADVGPRGATDAPAPPYRTPPSPEPECTVDVGPRGATDAFTPPGKLCAHRESKTHGSRRGQAQPLAARRSRHRPRAPQQCRMRHMERDSQQGYGHDA